MPDQTPDTAPTRRFSMLQVDDVVLAHPDHPERTGRWRVLHRGSGKGTIEVRYRDAEGAEGWIIRRAIDDVELPIQPAAVTRRHDHIAGLRRLADLLEREPGIAIPGGATNSLTIYGGGIEQAELILANLGRPTEANLGDQVSFTWWLGGVRLGAYVRREDVCDRIVTDTYVSGSQTHDVSTWVLHEKFQPEKNTEVTS